jgi:hypothetical protein
MQKTSMMEDESRALHRLSKLVQDVRDSKQIDDIKARLQAEHLTVQMILDTRIEQELNEISRNISALSSVCERSDLLKHHLSRIQQLVEESHDELAHDYIMIKAIAVAYRNSIVTRRLAKNLEHFPEFLAYIKVILDSNDSDQAKKLFIEHLLTVHYTLAQIDRFQYTTLLSMKKTVDIKEEVWEAMEKKLDKVSHYNTLFEQQLWLWTQDLFQLVKTRPKTIMHIMKVIDYEERMDRLKETHLSHLAMRFRPQKTIC